MITIEPDENQSIEEALFEHIKELGEIDFKGSVKDKEKIKLIKNAIVPSTKERRRIRTISNIFMRQANDLFFQLTEQNERKKNLLREKFDEITTSVKREAKYINDNYLPTKAENKTLEILFKMGLFIGTISLLHHFIKPAFKEIDIQQIIIDKVKIHTGVEISKETFKNYLRNNLDKDFQNKMRQIYVGLRRILEYANDIFTYDGLDEAVDLTNMMRETAKRLYYEYGDIVPIDYLNYRMGIVLQEIMEKKAEEVNDEALSTALRNFRIDNNPRAINTAGIVSDEEIDSAILNMIDENRLIRDFNEMVKMFEKQGLKGGSAIHKTLQVFKDRIGEAKHVEMENVYREEFYGRENFKNIDIVEENDPLLQKEDGVLFSYRLLEDDRSFIIPFYVFPKTDLGKEIISDFFFKHLAQQFKQFSEVRNSHRIKDNIEESEGEKFVTLEETLEEQIEVNDVVQTILPNALIDPKSIKRNWIHDDNDILDECLEEMNETREMILKIFKKEKEKELKRKHTN